MPGPEKKDSKKREGARRKTFQERERKRDRGRGEVREQQVWEGGEEQGMDGAVWV